jgi:hypothetical protein
MLRDVALGGRRPQEHLRFESLACILPTLANAPRSASLTLEGPKMLYCAHACRIRGCCKVENQGYANALDSVALLKNSLPRLLKRISVGPPRSAEGRLLIVVLP